MTEREFVTQKMSELKKELPNIYKLDANNPERKEKIALINKYELVLSEINKAEKEISQNKQQQIKNQRNELYNFNIPYSDGTQITVPSIYSYIQNDLGIYQDALVFYKGYSEEYKTEFLLYSKIGSNEILSLPVVNIMGHLITYPPEKIVNNPISVNKMLRSFKQQGPDKIQAFKNIESIPSIIGYNKKIDIKEIKAEKQPIANEQKEIINEEKKETINNNQERQEKNSKFEKIPIEASDNSIIMVQGKHTLMQNSRGQYKDIIVLYKGYSNEYKLDFIVYATKDKGLMVAPVYSLNGKLVTFSPKKITNDPKLMEKITISFQQQFASEIKTFKGIESIPDNIGYFNENQNTQTKLVENNVDKNPTPNLKYTLDDSKNKKLYYYTIKKPWYSDTDECARNLFKYLKEKPNLDIYIECLHKQDPEKYDDDFFENNTNDMVIILTTPIEKLDFDEQVWSKSKEEWTDFLSKFIGNQVDENYLKDKFYPTFNTNKLNNQNKIRFLTDLAKNNPKAQITEIDNYINSNIPLSELETENVWPFFIDKNGYIIGTNQKLAKYSFNILNKDFKDADLIKLSRQNIDDDPFFDAMKIPNYIDENIVNNKDSVEENVEQKITATNQVDDEKSKIQQLEKELELLREKNRLLLQQIEMQNIIMQQNAQRKL